MKYIKYIKIILAVIIAGAFIFIPKSTSNLYIRLHFESIQGDVLQLYYTTVENNSFCEEQSITSYVDKENRSVSFCLDKSLYNQLGVVRLDFAQQPETLCVNGISISSGGMVKKELNPGNFISDENMIDFHNVAFSPVPERNKTFIVTQEGDPYIVFSPEITQQINQYFSKGYLTRFLICIFVLIVYVSYKKNIFNFEK